VEGWRGNTYQQFDDLSFRLKLIFQWAAWYIINKYNKFVEVTECYRSDADHRDLLKRLNRDYYPSPHSDYRGLDFIIEDGKVLEYEDVEETINLVFPYGKPKYKTALYHGGTGYHIHLQVAPGTL